MMRVVPLSCCRNSCVLRAIRAEKSVGSASASSSALVCSDCVWPCVAAIASMVVRITLLNTSCAVNVEAGGKARAQIFDAVGQRVGKFEVLRRACLLHVIAGDRDRVEPWHLL